MHRLLPTFAILAAGCACEHGIGLSGDQDAADETSQSSWDPPIENLGEVGWRDSEDPLCAGLSDEVKFFDVWCYSGGVYVLARDWIDCSPCTEDNVIKIFFNDGTGWTEPFVDMLGAIPPDQRSHCLPTLTGTPSGRVLFSKCGERTVMIEGGEMVPAEFMGSVFVVNDSLAFACAREGLLTWDGSFWTRLSLSTCPGNGKALWADQNTILRTGDYGILHVFSEGEWSEVDTTILSSLSSVWATSLNDIWVGSTSGMLVHFDGTGWHVVDWGMTEPDEILGIWGSDTSVYFFTSNQFAMWDGTSASVLGYWPGIISIIKMVGNSTHEIFLGVDTNPLYFHEGCGDVFLLMWDGSDFHWL